MKAVICGAGIAGLALAHRLSAEGWRVVVLERSPGPRAQGYMIDFFGPGYDAAEDMGLLERMGELGYRVEGVSYVDPAGRLRTGLAYEQFEKAIGGRLLSIMRPDLELVLRERVTDRVDLRFGCEVTGTENSSDGVRVTTAGGAVVEGDLLVGADGVHSAVRELTFGPEERYRRYLGFHTAAYVFDDPSVYRQLGNRFCLTDTTGRQMGFYGLRDGRVAVFTVHREPDPAVPEDPRAAVRDAYRSLGWVAPRALRQCPPPSELYYDQVSQIEVPRWSRERVVLLGDSCQAVSLLAGQGASVAIGGAYVLAEQLAGAATIGEAFERYQRIWKPVVEDKQKAGRRGAEWFLPSSSTRLAARRIMLKLAGLPYLDRVIGTALAGKPKATIEQVRRERPVVRQH